MWSGLGVVLSPEAWLHHILTFDKPGMTIDILCLSELYTL